MQLPEESSDIFFLRGRSVIYKRWGKRAITSFFAFPIFWGEQSFTRWEGYDFSMTQKPANDISLFFTFGYAATFAWASAVFFHNLLFTDISLAVTCSAFYIAGMAISVVSLAAMGSLDALVRRSMGSRVALCVIAALTCIGTFCTAHAAIETEYGPVALFAGIIFTGLGSGYLIALWGWFIGGAFRRGHLPPPRFGGFRRGNPGHRPPPRGNVGRGQSLPHRHPYRFRHLTAGCCRHDDPQGIPGKSIQEAVGKASG